MKSIEKFAIVLIVLSALQLFAAPALLWASLHFVSASGKIEPLSTIVGGLSAVVRISINVVCAVWLHREAKRHSASPWVWCLLGFTSGLIAVALFYVYMLYLQGKTNETKQGEPTGCGDGPPVPQR